MRKRARVSPRVGRPANEPARPYRLLAARTHCLPPKPILQRSGDQVMRAFRNYLLSTVVAASTLLAAGSQAVRADDEQNPVTARDYHHVLLISVDGMHAVDMNNWI